MRNSHQSKKCSRKACLALWETSPDVDIKGWRPFPLLKSGFTLLEVLLVILIISLAFTLIAPNLFSFFSSLKEEAALQKFASSIRTIYSDSLLKKEEAIFFCDIENGKYGKGKEEHSLPSSLSLVDILTPSSSFHNGTVLIKIGPNLMQDIIFHFKKERREQTLRFTQNDRGKYFTLFWKPIFGETEIKEGYLSPLGESQ